jgi:hypothetical protein
VGWTDGDADVVYSAYLKADSFQRLVQREV